MAKDEKMKKNKDPKKSFLKESKAELKKVSWPTPKRLANDTTTVIGIVLAVAIIVFVLDFIFLAINENVLIKTEEKIKNSTSTETIVENNTIDENATNSENDITSETTSTENVETPTTENNTAE